MSADFPFWGPECGHLFYSSHRLRSVHYVVSVSTCSSESCKIKKKKLSYGTGTVQEIFSPYVVQGSHQLRKIFNICVKSNKSVMLNIHNKYTSCFFPLLFSSYTYLPTCGYAAYLWIRRVNVLLHELSRHIPYWVKSTHPLLTVMVYSRWVRTHHNLGPRSVTPILSPH